MVGTLFFWALCTYAYPRQVYIYYLSLPVIPTCHLLLLFCMSIIIVYAPYSS